MPGPVFFFTRVFGCDNLYIFRKNLYLTEKLVSGERLAKDGKSCKGCKVLSRMESLVKEVNSCEGCKVL
jgi:hypothetical protein